MDESKVVIQPLSPAWYDGAVAALDMLRLDALHSVVSGNKWYKLLLNIKHAINNNFKGILTFGGGYSNHLAATAYAAKTHGLPCVGVVRGNYPTLTPTLEDCRKWGMQLVFTTTQQYSQKTNPEWLTQLATDFDNFFVIPEGGDNVCGRQGAALIGRFVPAGYTYVLVSVGTGATLCGLRNALPADVNIIGFAPMKRGTYVQDHIATNLHTGKNISWNLTDAYHFGGFGKVNDELLDFMNDFYEHNLIPLDIVYTGKMMFGVRKMLESGAFKSTDRLLCIHTGGLQGNCSVPAGRLVY